VTTVYIDASAFLSLLLRDPRRDALAAHLSTRRMVASELLRTECGRALTRFTAGGGTGVDSLRAAAASRLARVGLLVIDRATLDLAARLPDPLLRTLDAVHVATALRLGSAIEGLVTYDHRQAQAAERVGLSVFQPA
jgi:predicted nucleic acid-binding protein